MYSRRLTIESHSPPVKDSSVHNNTNRLSLPIPYCDDFTDSLNGDIFSSVIEEMNNIRLNMWSVSPEKLIIDADNKERRILLQNHSNLDMR